MPLTTLTKFDFEHESRTLEAMVTARQLRVERIPGLLVGLLDAAGKLPRVPKPPVLRGHRDPTLEEQCALEWLAIWDGPRLDEYDLRKPAGVAAYQDRYDYHSASDVREIVYLVGAKRPTFALVHFIADSARDESRRCIGTFDVENVHLGYFLKRMGAMQTRITFEDLRP